MVPQAPSHDAPTSRPDRPSRASHPVRPCPRLRHRPPKPPTSAAFSSPSVFKKQNALPQRDEMDMTGRLLLADQHPCPTRRCSALPSLGSPARPPSSACWGLGAPLPSPGRRAWPRQTLPESGQGLWPQGPGGVLSVPLGPELGTLRDGGPPRGHRVGPRGRPGLRPLYVHTLRAHVS